MCACACACHGRGRVHLDEVAYIHGAERRRTVSPRYYLLQSVCQAGAESRAVDERAATG